MIVRFRVWKTSAANAGGRCPLTIIGGGLDAPSLVGCRPPVRGPLLGVGWLFLGGGDACDLTSVAFAPTRRVGIPSEHRGEHGLANYCPCGRDFFEISGRVFPKQRVKSFRDP